MTVLTTTACRECGAALPYSGTGRARVWCDNRCKMRHRSRSAEQRRCGRCGEEKARSEFNPDVRYTSGLQAWCRECMKTYRQERRDRSRMLERRSKYGVSIEWQEAQWAEQEGRCWCCGRALPFADAHLDHNHATGAVRGFLCQPCNLTIGSSGEDIDRLMAVAAYLMEHS